MSKMDAWGTSQMTRPPPSAQAFLPYWPPGCTYQSWPLSVENCCRRKTNTYHTIRQQWHPVTRFGLRSKGGVIQGVSVHVSNLTQHTRQLREARTDCGSHPVCPVAPIVNAQREGWFRSRHDRGAYLVSNRAKQGRRHLHKQIPHSLAAAIFPAVRGTDPDLPLVHGVQGAAVHHIPLTHSRLACVLSE